MQGEFIQKRIAGVVNNCDHIISHIEKYEEWTLANIWNWNLRQKYLPKYWYPYDLRVAKEIKAKWSNEIKN